MMKNKLRRFASISILISVCMLQRTAQSAVEKYHLSNPHSEQVAELSKYGVQVFDEMIVTADGKEFPRIYWKSEFQKKLYRKLEDPVKAKHIYESYEEFLWPLVENNPTLSSELANWIIENAFLLGSVNHNAYQIFEQYKLCESLIAQNKQAKHKLKYFFNRIHLEQDKSPHKSLAKKEKQHFESLTFLTTSGGGGHFTTSASMEASIRQSFGSKIKIRTIDHAKEQLTCDPLFIATQKVTSDHIYNNFFQKENDTPKAVLYWSLYGLLQDYIPFTCNRQVKDKVNQVPTDLLISTMSHFEIHSDLAYSHDIPLRYTGTDYALASGTYHPALYSSDKLIHYWLPSGEKEIFSSFLHTPSKTNSSTQVQKDLTKATSQIDPHVKIPLHINKKFKVLGFPLRRSFDHNKWKGLSTAQLKSKRGLPEQKKVITVTMGANGVGVVSDIALRAQTMAKKFKDQVHFVIICGKNTLSRAIIESFIYKSARNLNAPFSMETKGFVAMDEMAELLYISDAIISKPGGATTAEAAAIGTPMLITRAHKWEIPNQNFLLRNNLGKILKNEWLIVEELQEMLNLDLKKKVTYIPVNWKSRLNNMLTI